MPFVEANFVASAIAPDRGGFGFGAQARLIGANWHASVAVTGDDIDAAQPRSDDRTLLARAHWNPIKRDGTILHLGAWTFDEKFIGGTRNLSAGANVAHGLNPRTVLRSPQLAGATGNHGGGVEAGAVVGPVWVMGEAGRRVIDLPQSDARTVAKSLSAGWFVTGEAPPYAAATGGIGRPIVKRSVFQGGRGQVELTARYQEIDVRTPGLRSTGASATGGANWYLSGLMRVMVNATAWRLTPDRSLVGAGRRTDRGTTFVLRTQIVF
ncbi:porin [Sphingomonas hengshuiensis]|uniref:porin n=1 Tax=Sphingomonas hengshuiensis TaxID=1609977 RepID=UPI001D1024EA|nr:porin [Sphingomonas hengshuiensis]